MSESGQPNYHLKYESLTALYVGHVILNASEDEVMLDLSSGVVQDPGSSDLIVPIHTRVAMTRAGAMRLAQLLNETLMQAGSARASADVSMQNPEEGTPPAV